MRTEWIGDWRLTDESTVKWKHGSSREMWRGWIQRISFRGLGTVGNSVNIMMMKILIT
jgi:hypothetical protein